MNHRITSAIRKARCEKHPIRIEKRKRKKEHNFKNEDSLRDLWNNMKRNKICIIGVPEVEERGIKESRNNLEK